MTDKQKAITRYRESDIEKEEQSPLERLRFFCSLAMSGDDWLDAEMFFDSLALQVRRTVDPGPWSTGTTSDGRQYLESTDFTHDVRLYVDGDFAWPGDKANYARGLASQLNASAVSTEPICWVRPVTTAPDLGGFQVCREGEGFPVCAHPNGMYAPVRAEPVGEVIGHELCMSGPVPTISWAHTPMSGSVECPIPVGSKLYAAPVAAQAQNPDDIAVDMFAAAMKAKLAKKRSEGRGGWQDKAQCSQHFLSTLLREHVEKGDPVDVGNLAMMLHQRGEAVAAQAQPASVQDSHNWVQGPYVTNTVGSGWCVRIDGTDVFADLNQYGCKGRITFQVAGGLSSKVEADAALADWLCKSAQAQQPVSGAHGLLKLTDSMLDAAAEYIDAHGICIEPDQMEGIVSAALAQQDAETRNRALVENQGIAKQCAHNEDSDIPAWAYAGVTVWVGDKKVTKVAFQMDVEACRDDKLLRLFEGARFAINAANKELGQ